eukprot:TRINITY_DN27573_c0_g1_i2.p1 TRINITY_DN27573_c0_g1~~TRINITY_DN27573_c0_g1_i2.p1  ORF type:complete len:443 (+),score=78.98 TRINITY_DN27573_c0_g1_i2:58-1386(+)
MSTMVTEMPGVTMVRRPSCPVIVGAPGTSHSVAAEPLTSRGGPTVLASGPLVSGVATPTLAPIQSALTSTRINVPSVAPPHLQAPPPLVIRPPSAEIAAMAAGGTTTPRVTVPQPKSSLTPAVPAAYPNQCVAAIAAVPQPQLAANLTGFSPPAFRDVNLDKLEEPTLPESLTHGLPDPASIERQKSCFAQGLEGQLQQGTAVLNQQLKQQTEYLYAVGEQHKRQYGLAIDQQIKQQEMQLAQQHNEQILMMQKAAQQQKSALEHQANALLLEFNQKKASEELLMQQYNFKRQHYETQLKFNAEMKSLQAQQAIAQQQVVHQHQQLAQQVQTASEQAQTAHITAAAQLHSSASAAATTAASMAAQAAPIAARGALLTQPSTSYLPSTTSYVPPAMTSSMLGPGTPRASQTVLVAPPSYIPPPTYAQPGSVLIPTTNGGAYGY